MVGKNILHYKIIEKLGQGGMGVVYLGEDTKLERQVAIKFLPRHIAGNSEERKRFEIEAKAAAALNHPNIATIHNIEETDDELFIVMEYVDGQELKEKIKSGTISIDDAINFAIHIAEGLQAAHEKGIIHRDIKSSNIMITDKGKIKIMDFGLAKFQDSAQLTKTGTTIGTVAYMSPEQARGEDTDQRSDIWSFGILLYEILCGELPFKGDYEQAMVYAILNEDYTPPENYRDDIPSQIKTIITKCLKKDKEQRYQDMSEVSIDLKNSEKESSQTIKSKEKITKSIRTSGKSGSKKIILSVSILLIVVVVSSYFIFFSGDSTDMPEMKMVRLTSYGGEEQDPVLSPDGKTLAFCWDGPERNNFDIYIKLVDAGDPVRLTDSPQFEDYPAWSPDSKYIAFVRSTGKNRDEIYAIPSLGGNERLIGTLRQKDDGGICWSADGRHIYFSDETEDLGWRIYKISVETMEKEQVTATIAGQENLLDYTPRVSPDGQYLAFVRRSPATSADVYFLNLKNEEITRLTNDDLPINGLTWTPDSRFIVFNSNRDGAPGLWRISPSGGRPQKIAVSGATLSYPSISLYGNRLVYYEYQVNENIWKVNLENPRIQQPVIMTTQHKHFANISPDGSKIAYSSNRTGSYEIWICDSDGSNHNQLTHVNSPDHQAISWSPDGQNIVFSSTAMGLGNRLYVVSVNGEKPKVLANNALLPGWSRDGQKLYYSNYDGMFRISVNGTEEEQLIKAQTIFVAESYDGEYIFTSKVREGRNYFQDLWRMPVSGGEEELFIERDNYRRWIFGSWAIAEKGVYYIDSP